MGKETQFDTQYYYSIDDVLNVKSIALVYSEFDLRKDDIPNLAIGVGCFECEAKVDADPEGSLTLDLSTVEDYENFKINYVVILDEIGAVTAFVRLLSTIKPADFSMKKITILFEYDVVTHTATMSLVPDYSRHISDNNSVHKHLLKMGRRRERIAMTKADVMGAKSYRNPYFANLVQFAGAKVGEGMLKYSGDLYYKDGEGIHKLCGNGFKLCGNTPVAFTEVNGEQTLVSISESRIFLSVAGEEPSTVILGAPADGSVEKTVVSPSVLKYVALDGITFSAPLFGEAEGPLYLYATADLMSYADGGDTPIGIPMSPATLFMYDAVTNEPYYYRLTSGGGFDWKHSSHSLQKKLNTTLYGSDASFGELVAVTDGLSIFKKKDGSFVLCSGQDIYGGGHSGTFVPSSIDMAVALSGSAVLLRQVSDSSEHAWLMAELISKQIGGQDTFIWSLTNFGNEGDEGCYYPSIYKVARRRATTPYSNMDMGLSYKGLRYAYTEEGDLISL